MTEAEPGRRTAAADPPPPAGRSARFDSTDTQYARLRKDILDGRAVPPVT